ncbi:class I SAM-dependent methyltransferase [Methylobacterium iners]
MLKLLAAGASGLAVGAGLFLLAEGRLVLLAGVLVAASLVPLCLGLSMLVYGLLGKHRVRDHMIGLIAWRGDEQVLDIGTGRGLLLIGAAKRLGRRGQATGIDVWRSEDLSDNSLDRLAENVGLEGVEDNVALLTQDARQLSFPDASFDVVLSLFCIHNIESKAEQRQACREIARVLKPGGRVLVGEWLPTHAYAEAFREAGLRVNASRSHFLTALALMWMVDAEKPRVPAGT